MMKAVRLSGIGLFLGKTKDRRTKVIPGLFGLQPAEQQKHDAAVCHLISAKAITDVEGSNPSHARRCDVTVGQKSLNT